MKGKAMRISLPKLGAAAVFCVGAVFSLSFPDNFLTPKRFVFSLFLALILFILGMTRIRKPGISILKNPPFLFSILFLTILGWSSFESPLPPLSQTKTFQYFLWILFTLSMALISINDAGLDGLWLVELLGVPLCIYGFMQHFGLDPIVWHPGGTRIFSLIGNADHFAAVVCILLALSATRVLFQPALWRFMLIFAEFLALLWSYTRAPFPALFAAALIALILFGKALPWKKIAVIGSVFVILFGAMLLRGGDESRRFNPKFWKSDHDVIGREYLFEKGFQLTAFYPWTGVGPGNFSEAYLFLREDEPEFYRNRFAIGESTHNTFLDLFAEMGLLGGCVFVLIWLSALYRLFKKTKSADAVEREEAAILFVPLLSAFFVLQFIFPDQTSMALTGALLGISAGFKARENETFQMRPLVVSVLFFLIASLVLAYSVRITAADWLVGKERYEAAGRWNPWNPQIDQKIGKLYENSNPVQSLFYYDKAVNLDDENPYFWADIGRLAAGQHWKKRALTAYAKAVLLDPYNPILRHDAALTAANFHASRLSLFFAGENK